uniref:Glycoside hydrolase 35 catalytic domain-containing protein n=2 Tax=Tetranychus urticae TaxID=32264 RepID=T1KEA4_TETUR
MDLHATIILLLIFLITRVSFGQRQFQIDWSNNVFLKDGQPFQYVSGSFHYFRVPVEYWSDRMIKMRSAGLNAIQTYIEWRSHEPSIGVYNFEDNLNLFGFIEMAQKHDLLVILRPGPYICAERDMGGLPSWLLTEDPSMALRSNDSRYLNHVNRWFNYLLPRLNPYLYKNGGPVIMMQVENEYGSYFACDFSYTSYLRDLMANLTNNDVVLFTTDGNALSYLKCGLINGTFGTIDFGPGTDVAQSFSYLRSRQPNGPLVNSEYYTGWLDHWAEPHSVTSDELVIKTLETMLSMNVSINM